MSTWESLAWGVAQTQAKQALADEVEILFFRRRMCFAHAAGATEFSEAFRRPSGALTAIRTEAHLEG